MVMRTGNRANNTLRGRDEDDRLVGLGGNDLLLGLDGRDALFGGDGHDRLFGGAGNDRLSGGSGNDLLYGEAGADRLSGGPGADRLFGQAGNDTLVAEADGARDLLIGGAGDDELFAKSPEGAGLRDLLRGDAGNDTYHIGSADSIDKSRPDPGIDTVVVYANTDYTLGPQQENITDYFRNANHGVLRGNAGDNILTGGFESILFGMGGNDTFVSNPYLAARIDGGSGVDTLKLPFSSQAWFEAFRYDVRNIEILDVEDGFPFGHRFDLSPAEVIAITNGANTLRIHAEVSDIIDSEVTWTFHGSAAQGGRMYDLYTAGGATLKLDQDLQVAFSIA